MYVASGTQTRLTGKFAMNGGFWLGKSLTNGPFSSTPCLITRGCWLMTVWNRSFVCSCYITGTSFNGLTKKGNSIGNQRFSHEIWEFPEFFPVKTNLLTASCKHSSKYTSPTCKAMRSQWYLAMTKSGTDEDWRCPPSMCGLFFGPMFQSISPQNMAKHMVRKHLHF